MGEPLPSKLDLYHSRPPYDQGKPRPIECSGNRISLDDSLLRRHTDGGLFSEVAGCRKRGKRAKTDITQRVLRSFPDHVQKQEMELLEVRVAFD
jgi:hypothetical protein